MSICSLYNSLKHIRKDIYHNDEYDIGFWLEDGFVCVFRTITSKFGIYQMEIIDDIYFTCIKEFDTCVEVLSYLLCNYLKS
jgi:hypothetical protein